MAFECLADDTQTKVAAIYALRPAGSRPGVDMDPMIDITFGGVVDRWNSAPESDPAWVLIEV